MLSLTIFGIIGLLYYFLLAKYEQGKDFNVVGNIVSSITGLVLVLVGAYFIGVIGITFKPVLWLLHAAFCAGGFLFQFAVVRFLKIKKQSNG